MKVLIFITGLILLTSCNPPSESGAGRATQPIAQIECNTTRTFEGDRNCLMRKQLEEQRKLNRLLQQLIATQQCPEN